MNKCAFLKSLILLLSAIQTCSANVIYQSSAGPKPQSILGGFHPQPQGAMEKIANLYPQAVQKADLGEEPAASPTKPIFPPPPVANKSLPPNPAPSATPPNPPIKPIDQAFTAPVVVEQQRFWNLRNVDIRSVIEAVSHETGKNFVVDPKVQGNVTIVSSTPLNPEEVYQVFLASLQIIGFSAVPAGKIIKIVPSVDARQGGVPVTAGFRPGRENELITRVLTVKNVPVDQLVPILRPLLPDWGSISAYQPAGVIIIAGTAENVERLVEIIHRVDTANTAGIDAIPLHYATAQDIVATLQELLAAAAKNTPVPLSIAADDRSNMILLSGNKSERLKMRVLISELDTANSASSSANTQVIYLHFLKAKDIVPILSGIAQSYFSGTVGTVIGTISESKDYSAGPAEPTQQSEQPTTQVLEQYNTVTAPNAGPNTTNNESSRKPHMEIIAEPSTNAIIINAPPTIMRILRAVVNKLDIRPAQVLVEALIAEVSEDTTARLGIQWGSLIGTNGIGPPDNNQTANTFQQGLGIITGKGIHNIQGIINAIAKDQNANILSKPSVVVLDNHQAKILVGSRISIQESNYPNNAGGTTNATPYNTFARENVVLHLFVTPQIAHDCIIQLAIDQGNDRLANPNNPTTTPVVNTSSIKTNVMVNSGDILVLGGLNQNDITNGSDRVPYLGHVPLIGHIFRMDSKAKRKKNLMIFLRPVIIPDRLSSLRVTGNKYNYIRNEELGWLERQTPHDHWHPTNLLEPEPHPYDYVLPRLNKRDRLPSPFTKGKPEP